MGLLNSIKKFKFPSKKKKKKKRSRELLNEEEEIRYDYGEDILDADELCSDSSSIPEIDEDGKSRESDEESEDILDAGEFCSDSSSSSSSDHQEITDDNDDEEEEEDVLDLGDLSPLHEISTEEKNNALHLKRRDEIISIEEEDVLDLDEISHSSISLYEITDDEEENKSRELNEDGSSGEGRAQKCLRCPVQVKKEEIARNIKEEKNKALHVKKREIISIDKEEVQARKEERIREMIASEKQERAILEFDRALEYAKRKLRTIAEKPTSDECLSCEGAGPSCVLPPQNTSILQEEKPKKSKKRVTFILEEKEKDEGICISNEKEEKIERFDGQWQWQWQEKPRSDECVSNKGAGPRCVFGPQDTSIFQEEKPKKYEKKVKFTVEEKGKAEAIHVSNEEEKIERFAGQEEHKMKSISNEEDEKLEAFVNKKPTKKGHHHNGVCNEEEKIKEGLDEIRPQKKSVSSEEEKKKKINGDFAKRNPKKKVAFDQGRKVQGFDDRQANKQGPVSDCSFQWKELMEMKGNFDDDDGDVAEFNGGEQWGNSCGCQYCDEENVHHNKNLQFRYLFSFGIGLVMFLRVYYGISRYLLES